MTPSNDKGWVTRPTVGAVPLELIPAWPRSALAWGAITLGVAGHRVRVGSLHPGHEGCLFF